MGKMQRDKGANAEREVARLIHAELEIEVIRNLEQSRSGGHDLTGVDGWALEVKRQETLAINSWWKQTVQQALAIQKCPVLFYRQSRKPWTVMVDAHDVEPSTFPLTGQHTLLMDIECWCQIARETLPAQVRE